MQGFKKSLYNKDLRTCILKKNGCEIFTISGFQK